MNENKEEFKKCPNGHYYQGNFCPYCKTRNKQVDDGTLKTEVFIGGSGNSTIDKSPDNIPTKIESRNDKTTVIDDRKNEKDSTTLEIDKLHNIGTHTQFGDPDLENTEFPDTMQKGGLRTTRKLVGWLVSYSLDAMGVDYKLYEGRNIIGRDNECNITVPDPMVSAKHAVLLFRANKYSITDSQSSHGTFVNDEDIELKSHYLNDGDVIRMGRTVFKFRTAF